MIPVATPSAIVTDPIATYVVGDDSVILLDGRALVSSKSKPGTWWEVDAINGLCSCPRFVGIPGKFEGRGRCRHVDATRKAEELDRATAEPVARPMCCRCGSRAALVILGRQTSLCGQCTTRREEW